VRDSGDFLDSLLPLFPLDVVLFPGSPLPLHIFEPRYKEMIRECLAQNSGFGVVRAVEDGFADVGCSAEILSVTKEYEDGRLDIVTEGRRRFEIVRVDRERSFLRGEVRFMEDEADAAPKPDQERAAQLHAEILSIADAVQDLSAARPELLSFYLAGSLPLELDFKQSLLEQRSESERIAKLISYFEALIPKIRRASHLREIAGGNGHAQ
jgi:Lon protease-like protein